MKSIALYMAPDGSDSAQGTLDTPLLTIKGVFRRLSEMASTGERTAPVCIYLRGGEYPLAKPMTIAYENSAPICFMPYEGEKPVFSGGRRITGLREETTETGLRAWTATLPDVASGQWYFRELFVGGQRRSRTRLPKTGFFTMEDVPGVDGKRNCWEQLFQGTNSFVYREGDFGNYRNFQDIDVIAHHFWADERMPVATVDFSARLITSSARSVFVLQNDNNMGFANYYFENVYEGLSEPGQWYLDRRGGKLTYLPLPYETLETAELIAPVLNQFLLMNGSPEEGKYIENITFSGITFEYADWYHTMPRPKKESEYFGVGGMDTGDMPCATAPQAALHAQGAISMRGVKNCAFHKCVIRHVGFYAVEFRDGCFHNSVTDCVIEDTGAGGIRMGGSADAASPLLQTGMNNVSDNVIHRGGEVFLSGVGVLLIHSYKNIVRHNEIHDYYYTAISSGWVWGFVDNISRENLIENNHIHNLGKGLISDMGGVYILGIQAGTVVRGNYIHNIKSCNYGGWGIYLDEGASYVLVENNLVRDVSNQCFNQHYGRENIIRNNVFAFSGDSVLSVTRLDVGNPPRLCPVSSYTKNSLTFERNIVLSDGKPFHIFATTPPEDRIFTAFLNVYWNTALKEDGENSAAISKYKGENRVLSFEDLQKLGIAYKCAYADPGITLTEDGFTIAEDSIALAYGFQPFDVRRAGVRG